MTKRHLGVTLRGADPLARKISFCSKQRQALDRELWYWQQCTPGWYIPIRPASSLLPIHRPPLLGSRSPHAISSWINSLKEWDNHLQDKIARWTAIRMSSLNCPSPDHRTLRQMLEPGDSSRDLHVLRTEEGYVTDQGEISSLLHKHFSEVFRSESPPCSNDPDFKQAPAYIHESIHTPPNHSAWADFLSPITVAEVLHTIRQSPTGKAPGYYEVPMDIIKALVKNVTNGRVFLHICTSLLNGLLSLRGNTPATKPSILVLLRKDKNLATIPNLRPISLISTLSKILSKILADRLANIIFSHNLIHFSQQGFLPGRRCETLIAAVIDLFNHANEEKNPLFAMFYDLSGAFDRVDHSAICAGLRAIGAPKGIQDFFMAYLSGSSSRIRLLGGLSPPFEKSRGTPQGDPLSPYLFVIWISMHFTGLYSNPSVNDYLAFKGFGLADDTCHISPDMASLVNSNSFFESFISYFGGKINPKKCRLLVVNNRSRSLRVNGVSIRPPSSSTSTFKYLGCPLTPTGSVSPTIIFRILNLWSHTISNNVLTPRLQVKFWLGYFLPRLRWSGRFISDVFNLFRSSWEGRKPSQISIADLAQRRITGWSHGKRCFPQAAWSLCCGLGLVEDIYNQSARLALDLINHSVPQFASIFRTRSSVVVRMFSRWESLSNSAKKRSLNFRILCRPSRAETPHRVSSIDGLRFYVGRHLNRFSVIYFPHPISPSQQAILLSCTSFEAFNYAVLEMSTLDDPPMTYFNAIADPGTNSYQIPYQAACFALSLPLTGPHPEFCLPSLPDLSPLLSTERWLRLNRWQRTDSIWAIILCHYKSTPTFNFTTPAPDTIDPLFALADHLASLATSYAVFPSALLPRNFRWVHCLRSTYPSTYPLVSGYKFALLYHTMDLLWNEWNDAKRVVRGSFIPSSLPGLSCDPNVLRYLYSSRHSQYLQHILNICSDFFFAITSSGERKPRPLPCPCNFPEGCVSSNWRDLVIQRPEGTTWCSIQHSKICTVLSPPGSAKEISCRLRDSWVSFSNVPPDPVSHTVARFTNFWTSHTFPCPGSSSPFHFPRKYRGQLKRAWDDIFFSEYLRFHRYIFSFYRITQS